MEHPVSASRGLSGSSLKLWAMGLMVIDHIGAVLLAPMLPGAGLPDSLLIFLTAPGSLLAWAYGICRLLGRLSFPIYCFLLGEGFAHTHSRGRYLARLVGFGLLSEVPFDLASTGRWLELGHQNVFFTLALALLALWGWERFARQPELRFLSLAACALAADLGGTDYGSFGVLLVLALFLLRDRPPVRDGVGSLLCLWEISAPLAFLLIRRYNGTRGLPLGVAFYWFYPAHLLVLGLIRLALFS